MAQRKKEPVAAPQSFDIWKWTALLLLSAACVGVYYNSISGGFVFDDSTLVQTDDRIQKLSNIPRMLNPFSPAYLTYRPVRTISYAVDYHFSQYRPEGYHIANILYHCLCTWLAFLIARKLLLSWKPALLAAALFAVHPIHTEAVSYVSGRRDVLSTLFFLLGFYAFIRYRESEKPVLLAGVFAAYVLGVLSKEMAITLPAIMLLYDWYGEIRVQNLEIRGRRWGELAVAFKNVLLRYKVLYGLILGVGLFFIYYYLFVTPASTNLSKYWGGSVYTNFLTTIKIFAKYLQLMFWPVTLVADYNSGQVFPLAASLLEPIVLVSLFIVVAALAATAWMFKKDAVLGFGGLFFFLTLLPVSHIIPHHELISEHYLYLPSFGLCLLLARGVDALESRPATRWAYVGAGVILVLLSWRTVVRNRDWADEFSLWSATLRDAPLSMRAHTNLGLVYLSRDKWDQAIEHFEKSLAIPSKPELGNISRGRALQNLGVAYLRKKEYTRALECFQKCLELDPQNYVSFINMGVVYNARGENRQATDAYKKALEIFPSSKEAMLNLAIAYTRTRDFDAAISQYEKLIETDRGTDYTARAHFNMGFIYYYYVKDFELAAYHHEIARKMDPVKYSTEKWLGKPIEPQKIDPPPAKPQKRP